MSLQVLQAAILFVLQVALAPSGERELYEGSSKPVAPAAAIRSADPIRVDGILDEAVWATAPEIGGLTQRDPIEGAPPSQQTIVRITYDDAALYVGAQMFDTAPDSITVRLGRRDAQMESDYFAFFIDPYLDRRSGYYFAITAAGALVDGVLLNDDWNDDTWDGVWQGKARVDEAGWSAELRIPYSQLRFYRRDRYVWGVNVKRYVARSNEHSYLVYTPRNESGFVSRFVDLVGVEDIRPARQLELIPYVTSRAEYTHPEAADPFRDGSRYTGDVGADVRVGLSSNLTLTATLNPDFGQVEVDPAVVNLSAFETFYQEKRPFFVEGASIFNFGYGGSHSNWGFNWSNPNFFYTRRVGRPPQGEIPGDADYSAAPGATRILGAAKISGRVAGSWNVGTIHAVTDRARARIFQNGEEKRIAVEAPAYYGVVRALKEIDDGRAGIGLLSTGAVHAVGDGRLQHTLNERSMVVGLDGWSFLDRSRVWVVNGWVGASRSEGTSERMIALQRSPLHYFQRPDAAHVRVDSSATSMSGWAGRVGVNKQKGQVILNSAVGVVSPGFDVNDAGFQWQTDVVNMHFGSGYRWPNPGRFTRNALLIAAAFRSFDFSGRTTWTGLWGLAELQSLSYHELEVTLAFNPETTNNRLTRGGPRTINPPGVEMYAEFETDPRKRLALVVEGNTYLSRGGSIAGTGARVVWKPASNLDVSLGPRLAFNDEPSQWVDVYEDPHAVHTYGKRYVFAHMEQWTASGNLRVNWTFTPELSFQLFLQPLVSSGRFDSYKSLARPASFDFDVFGEGISTFDRSTFVADPDGPGPAAPIQLEDQDFTFRSLRGNAVVRWEYRPGSVLYLVWTQLRSSSDDEGAFRFGRSFGRIWTLQPDNIFVIKLTYWLG